MTKQPFKNGLRVVYFVARRKDNPHLPKEVLVSYLVDFDDTPYERWFEKFLNFAATFDESTYVRLYVSANKRDPQKVKHQLLHTLLDYTDNIAKFPQKVVSVAAKENCRLDKTFLLDVDASEYKSSNEALEAVESFLKEREPNLSYEVILTVSGYSVVTERGFDTRDLLAQLPEVTLQRDGYVLLDHGYVSINDEEKKVLKHVVL